MLPLCLASLLPLFFPQAVSVPTNPPPDTVETRPPALRPGGGWSAPTLPLVRPGFFDRLEPIAHWTRADRQIQWRRREADFYLGVLAYHRSEIDRVEFAVDGGAWETREETTWNPQTQYQEYGVRLEPDDFSLGWHEVRARVVPRAGLELGGVDRILKWRFFAGQRLLPGAHYGERWVNPVFGSDSGAGSAQAPFATLARAINDLANSATGADAGIVHLAGSHSVIGVGGPVQIVNNDLPLTIRSADGHRPWLAPQSSGPNETLPIRHLRVEHTRVDVSWNEMFRSGPLSGQAHLTFARCEFVGHTQPRQSPPGPFPTVYRLMDLFDYDHGRNVSMADCAMRNIDGNAHAFVGWMRGVHVSRGLIGGFGGSHCIIDSSVRSSPETQNVTSIGMWVGSWGGARDPIENVLVDGLRVIDHTGVLLNITEGCRGVAVVNSIFDGVNGAQYSQSEVGTVFEGEQSHILLVHCTSPQRLSIQYPANYLFEHMFGGLVTSSIWGDFYDAVTLGAPVNANLGGDPGNDGLSGLPVTGFQLEPTYMHVHGNRPHWSMWTQQGYTPTYVSLWQNNLHVRETSQASLTIPRAAKIVTYDGSGRARGDMLGRTTVGSRRGQGE